jgi:hypothetical protein
MHWILVTSFLKVDDEKRKKLRRHWRWSEQDLLMHWIFVTSFLKVDDEKRKGI